MRWNMWTAPIPNRTRSWTLRAAENQLTAEMQPIAEKLYMARPSVLHTGNSSSCLQSSAKCTESGLTCLVKWRSRGNGRFTPVLPKRHTGRTNVADIICESSICCIHCLVHSSSTGTKRASLWTDLSVSVPPPYSCNFVPTLYRMYTTLAFLIYPSALGKNCWIHGQSVFSF